MLPEIEQCTICVNLGLGVLRRSVACSGYCVFSHFGSGIDGKAVCKGEVQACNLFFSLRPCIWLASGFIHESSMDGLIIGSTA